MKRWRMKWQGKPINTLVLSAAWFSDPIWRQGIGLTADWLDVPVNNVVFFVYFTKMNWTAVTFGWFKLLGDNKGANLFLWLHEVVGFVLFLYITLSTRIL